MEQFFIITGLKLGQKEYVTRKITKAVARIYYGKQKN